MKNRGICLFLLLVFFFHSIGVSQNTRIVSCGTIKYEKKVSVKKKLLASQDDDDDSFWMEEMIKKAPNYSTEQFVMQFNPVESYYYYNKEASKESYRMWGDGDVATKNIVYKNMKTMESKSLKQFYENDFLLIDSVKQFRWKLTREFRDIAGFECRKAIAIFNDSLYVIAYYTDDITCNSGPESFGGLPGMVLGVVMPRLYTTWFATSVETVCDENSIINKPMKGKKSTEAALIEKISEKWGRYKKWYQSMVWNIVI